MDGFNGAAKRALEANANPVLGILHDTINELRGVAEHAKAANQRGLQVEALDTVGRISLRYLELTMGRKMSVNVNVRNQDELPDYRTLPPEARRLFDAALDVIEAHRDGVIIETKALTSVNV